MENKQIDLKDVMEKLNQIQIDINILKQNSVDFDTVLSEDDKVAISDYEKEKAEGNLISHEDLKKELGLNV
ncbi:MAG: hypothetical protein ABIH37_04300 [archaeon]